MEQMLNYFAGNNDSMVLTFVIIAMSALLVFLVLLIYIPVITKKVFPNFGYTRYSDYLPFNKVYKDNSLSMTDGSLVRVYKITGIQTNIMDDKNKEKLLDLRSQLFNQIQDPDVYLRFFTIRDFVDEKTNYEFDQSTLQKIYDKWNNQGLKIYNNTYYVVISVHGNHNHEKLNQCCNYIESILSAYRPILLENDKIHNMATFFGRILSPVSKPIISQCDDNIAQNVTVDNVEFNRRNGVIEYSSGDKTYYASTISFKMSPDYMDDEFFDTISTIQCEMICMNSFHILKPSDIESLIRQHRSTVTDENEQSTLEQINEAQSEMDENITGSQTLVDYYPLFILFGKSMEELDQSISEFKKISASFGISPVVEKFASKVSFFAQLPGFDIFPRSFKMLSKTAAISIPLSTMPHGVENCDWGPGPIVVFPTAQGTPYQFQFHVSDKPAAVAHTLTIGPTGGGKTTLFSFLIAQSLRHKKLKAFFFDRNKGAEIFTLAVDGKYITMNGKEKDSSKDTFLTHLNPLKMPDSASNRAFLRRWLSMISGQTDVISSDEIARAVSVNFDYLPEKDRLLKNLYESCFSSGGKMRDELKKWVDPLQYGDIFNENSDTLDLNSRLTTFDFTEILQDEILAPAVISYILHRINNITISGGNPSLIMIDETAPMLENKMFRESFIAGLQEGRKNRQAYMVAFQRANVLDKLGIGDVVRGQAQTVLFFRNPAADISDYEKWNLNPLEMAFIKGQAYPNLKRAVLLSRPVNNESVILNTELGGLGNMLKLFESGRSSVLLAEELYKTYGNKFVEEYLKKQG